MSTDHLDTRPREVDDQALPTLRHTPVTLRVAAHSDRGRVRANNEDRFLVLRGDRTTTPISTNIDADELKFVPAQTIWALAVADGMGGHAAGEVASTLALTLTLQYAQQGSRWYVDIGEREAREIVARVESILASVDRDIAEQAERESALAGMGTTLTVGGGEGRSPVRVPRRRLARLSTAKGPPGANHARPDRCAAAGRQRVDLRCAGGVTPHATLADAGHWQRRRGGRSPSLPARAWRQVGALDRRPDRRRRGLRNRAGLQRGRLRAGVPATDRTRHLPRADGTTSPLSSRTWTSRPEPIASGAPGCASLCNLCEQRRSWQRAAVAPTAR